MIFSCPSKYGSHPFVFSYPLNNYSQVDPKEDEDIEFKTVLTEATHFAFINYYNNCLNYDEFRPISKKCLNNYGFSVSLFESLETLFYLNMSEEFAKAKKYILDFNFDNRKYIDFHEFWSRGIASLISIYQLSGDLSFLFKASQLADQVLNAKKGDFINIKFDESLDLASGKQFLNNWLSGVPEIIILNELVQKPLYTEFIEKTLIKSPDNFIYPVRLTKKNKREPVFNSFTTSFITNSILIKELLIQHQRNYTINYSFLDKSNSLLKRFGLIKSLSPTELTLANQIFHLQKKYPLNLTDYLDDEKIFGDEKYMFGFHFNGAEIFDISKKKQFDIVKNITLNSLKKYRTANGFSGTTTSSIGKKYPDDIQHTEFLGEWIKVGAMIACGYKFLFQKGIFNEYGHILKILD